MCRNYGCALEEREVRWLRWKSQGVVERDIALQPELLVPVLRLQLGKILLGIYTISLCALWPVESELVSRASPDCVVGGV